MSPRLYRSGFLGSRFGGINQKISMKRSNQLQGAIRRPVKEGGPCEPPSGFGFGLLRRAKVFESLQRHLSILADLDEVAVGITHVTTSFPAVIV
jgi:hypothetical protein